MAVFFVCSSHSFPHFEALLEATRGERSSFDTSCATPKRPSKLFSFSSTFSYYHNEVYHSYHHALLSL